MTWEVADPSWAATRACRVVSVAVPAFPDEVDYEGILARHPAVEEAGPDDLVVLATGRGFLALRQAARQSELVGPAALARIVVDLARERQVVVLRRSP